MTKREMSVILSRCSAREVIEMGRSICEKHNVEMVKEPQKTLVMVKVRESIKQSLFYLGEVLAAECMVTVDGVKGSSVMAGDDFDKVMNAAIIDGFLNIGNPSMRRQSSGQSGAQEDEQGGVPTQENSGQSFCSEEVRAEQQQILAQLLRLKAAQEKERARLNGQLLKSKVNFNVMGE